jgi:hypothetical protein
MKDFLLVEQSELPEIIPINITRILVHSAGLHDVEKLSLYSSTIEKYFVI